MGRSVQFRVTGVPAPQGSKRAFVHKKTGKAVLIEQTHEHTRSWRAAVTEAAEEAICQERGWEPLRTPVLFTAVFVFRRPLAHYGTGRNAHLLKASAPPYPVTANTGDLSKLIRAVEDACTDAGLWHDDRFVVRYGPETGKYWAGPHGWLPVPGARIWVREQGLLSRRV